MTSTVPAEADAEPSGRRRAIVLIGAPGAGKGTQAERLAESLGLAHVSSGELFRDALRDGSELGQAVKSYMDRGSLVPDELTLSVVGGRIEQPDAALGFILDGFPRTRAQAERLDAYLERSGDPPAVALYVEVSPDLLVERLSGRRVCERDDQHVYHLEARPPQKAGVCDLDGGALIQRADDEPETVRARLERQLPPMYDVIDHYAEAGLLVTIAGGRAIDVVTSDMLAAIERATLSG